MTNPFSLVVDTNFSVMGQPAIYRRDGHPDIEIRVMPRRQDEVLGIGPTVLHSRGATFDVRVADIAAPQRGDRIVLGDDVYVVQGTPRYVDGDRLIWAIDTHAAEGGV